MESLMSLYVPVLQGLSSLLGWPPAWGGACRVNAKLQTIPPRLRRCIGTTLLGIVLELGGNR